MMQFAKNIAKKIIKPLWEASHGVEFMHIADLMMPHSNDFMADFSWGG